MLSEHEPDFKTDYVLPELPAGYYWEIGESMSITHIKLKRKLLRFFSRTVDVSPLTYYKYVESTFLGMKEPSTALLLCAAMLKQREFGGKTELPSGFTEDVYVVPAEAYWKKRENKLTGKKNSHTVGDLKALLDSLGDEVWKSFYGKYEPGTPMPAANSSPHLEVMSYTR